MHAQVSEVAALREQIAAEHTAAKLGLYGLNSGTPHHSFITARQANIGVLHEKLQDIVGDGAIVLVAETLDAVPDTPTRSDVLATLRHVFSNPEEIEPLCNALQEAWQAVDLLKEHPSDGQAPMGWSSLTAFAGVNFIKERFEDEQARKLIFAPPTARQELPPS